jgi:tRNA (mo5U34)-methyltransferase
VTLKALRSERQKWLKWKDILPLRELLQALPPIEGSFTCKHNAPSFTCKNSTIELEELIYKTAWATRPWRKGPFQIGKTFIDSEWQSFLKFNLLLPHLDLEDKIVGDIGCNNGYYLFRMLALNPKRLIGFDPSPFYQTQFDFINHFAKSSIKYELLGVEHLPLYEHKFDTLFCLGVLYHRSDPTTTLKALRKGLNSKGELFLDTFMIDGDLPVALCPGKTYSKIPNIYHIPTVSALENWAEKAGFSDMQIIDCIPTTYEEQRRTEWIKGESLGDFLNPNNPTQTVEGYPAPKRLYVKFLC